MSDSTRSRILEIMAEAVRVSRINDVYDADEIASDILAHLSAEGMAVVPGWQPIESAPKDGTRIILAWGGTAVTGSYLDNGHTAYPWKGWRVPSLELTPPGAPVAWMPFPEVPANVS